MKVEQYICLSTVLNNWCDRMWMFAVGIYMVKITPGSLQLAAIFGFVMSLSALILSPIVGDWIDRSARLKAVFTLLALQYLLIITCAITILLHLLKFTENPSLQILLKVLIVISGSGANVAGQGGEIAICRDWVVIVSRGSNDVLTRINTMIRRIDLTMAILAPFSVSLIMSLLSDETGLIFICIWNLMAMIGESLLILKVYKLVPELAVKSKANQGDKNEETEGNIPEENIHQSNWNIIKRFKTILVGWKVYRRQPVFLAGCALSALFFTVIGFGPITLGYAYLEGLSELYTSVLIALGSLFGVLGTFLYPKLRANIGLLKTGLVGIFMQWTMLLLCVLSIWLPGSPSNLYAYSLLISTNQFKYDTNLTASTRSPGNLLSDEDSSKEFTSIIVLMAGIVLSRTGLWIADLTITQIQQENVLEEERNIVGGVQYSSNCFFDILRHALNIFLPHNNQFGILVLLSVSAVGVSGIIYVIFLIHFSKEISRNKKK